MLITDPPKGGNWDEKEITSSTAHFLPFSLSGRFSLKRSEPQAYILVLCLLTWHGEFCPKIVQHEENKRATYQGGWKSKDVESMWWFREYIPDKA